MAHGCGIGILEGLRKDRIVINVDMSHRCMGGYLPVRGVRRDNQSVGCLERTWGEVYVVRSVLLCIASS